MGTSTITLPIKIVTSDCHQFMPVLIRPEASMYVGMQCAIEIHSAAYVYVVHVRFSTLVGARSSLKRAGSSSVTSLVSSTRPSRCSVCSIGGEVYHGTRANLPDSCGLDGAGRLSE